MLKFTLTLKVCVYTLGKILKCCITFSGWNCLFLYFVLFFFFFFFFTGEFSKPGEEDTKEKGYLSSGRSVGMLAATNIDEVLGESYKKIVGNMVKYRKQGSGRTLNLFSDFATFFNNKYETKIFKTLLPNIYLLKQ